MITARVDSNSQDMFVRNRLRVLAEVGNPDTRERYILGRAPEGGDYLYRPPWGEPVGTELPEGVSLYTLDASTDVAHAVYLALKAHFEPQDAVPTASDRAYSDARTDITRQHALIEKLIDARPLVIATDRPPLPPPGA